MITVSFRTCVRLLRETIIDREIFYIIRNWQNVMRPGGGRSRRYSQPALPTKRFILRLYSLSDIKISYAPNFEW